MRKIFLSILCLAGLYAETSFFLGFGGGYGAKSEVSVEGKRISLEGKYYSALQRDFLKLEGIIGFETIFSDYFGVRYYVNIAQNNLIGVEKDEYLIDLESGLNLDLLFNIPIDKTLALRIYTGINSGSHFLYGALMDNIQKFFKERGRQSGNYEMGYSSNLKTTSLNLGLHLLFSKRHVLELGSRILLLTAAKPIFFYRETTDPREPRSNLNYQTPAIELLAKYIFVF